MRVPADSIWAIRCVWLRYFDVFRKSLLYGTLVTFLEPFLYLLSFGFGVGAIVGNLDVRGVTVSYRQFVFAGVVGQAVLFLGFFEAAYGSFIRYYYQRIFQAMATTPITLSEVLWGELFWDASKGTFSAGAVLLIGSLIGDFSPWGALCSLPLCFVSSFLFAALGLWVAAISETIEQISYPQYLIVFPMFLFCGVFFPLEQLPYVLRLVAWVLPLTSMVSLIQTLTLGFAFEWQALPIILCWLVLLVVMSRRAMFKRLIK